ncbi:tryptophan 7-halogenase [Actinomadura fibrosa]|uniref:Tryptophan 7-halogenase n=1 Tax=Actinomadura fibrosa TaxID=111802 RepID=A0ABW2Y334_9ACTN|nr:tryptophan 7-halogenase [Actinomadura fibrosa]
MSPDGYDLIVVGGGPGGSTAASLAALDGHRVLLLEKERFPRYQIGESLLPSTVHDICSMLGVGEEVRRAGFTPKHGGTFRWGANPEPWTFTFGASPRMADSPYAFQVERMRFDQILLDHARRVGVDVRERHSATGVLREGDRVAGVRYRASGREERARARFVIDASGHGSRLHHHVGGRREYSPFFRNLAVFGYFEGGHRLPEPDSGNIVCVAFGSGWFWYIPLSPTLTSVGAVVGQDAVAKVQGDPDAALDAFIGECPTVGEYLADARRATREPYDRVRVRKDFSYDRTAVWCPGMALVGDAACFIDPVFSSGVHLATYSALLAARSVNTALADDVDEERCFTEFEGRYRREFGHFRDFLTAFYQMHVDEDSYFWQARKITEHPGSAQEAFIDLVGGMTAADFAPRPTDGSGEDGDPAGAAPPAQKVGPKVCASIGGAERRAPMLPGGLVASAGGLRWAEPA